MPVPAEILDLLSKTGLPEAAYAPLLSKLDEYTSMVAESNSLVAQINAAKAQDPNNVDYLDTLWRAEENGDDKKLTQLIARFDKVAEQYESYLSQLREIAKTSLVKAPLSEDDAKAAKKTVNEMAPALNASKAAIGEMFTIPATMLGIAGVEIPEGGIVSMLPQAESLKNARGRRAATASGEVKVYKTRIGEGLIDGESTAKDGKSRFDWVADALNAKWDAGPANKVTGEELEEAFFAHLNIPFRSKSSKEIPDETVFEFEKVLHLQNPNDDSVTDVPKKVTLTIRSTEYGKENEGEASAEKVAETEKAAASE